MIKRYQYLTFIATLNFKLFVPKQKQNRTKSNLEN